MHTITSSLKETLQLIGSIMIVSLLIKMFLKCTMVGKLLSLICRDIYLFLKLCFRISKNTLRFSMGEAKKLNNLLYKYYKKLENHNQTSKKVACGENDYINNKIIDFKQVSRKHNK